MRFTNCKNSACGRPFQINTFSPDMAPAAKPGLIACPHCEFVVAGSRNFIYHTHALSEKEEAQFNARLTNELNSE